MREHIELDKHILASARFLRLGSEAQILYMYLVADADENGLVDVFAVMRKINCNEGSLIQLIDSHLIQAYNDDRFVFEITDWNKYLSYEQKHKKLIKILQSNRILQISTELRMLYVYLYCEANCDGIAEVLCSLHLTGLKDSSLEDLVNAGLITILDRDRLQVVITDLVKR